MTRRVCWLVLAALWIAPLASAAAGEGSFTVEGKLTYPAQTHTEGEPLALFLVETTDLGALTLTFPRGIVYEYRVNFGGGGLLPSLQVGNAVVRSWPVEDATVSLVEGDHSGFLGLYPGAGSTLYLDGSMHQEPAGLSGIGNGKSSDGEAPESFNYYREVVAPHLLTSGQPAVQYVGGGGVKLRGPDVQIQSANATRHATGKEQTGIGQETATWLYIHFEGPATLTANGSAVLAAVSTATASWDGALRFTPREGSLRAEDGTYLPRGRGVEQVEGAFTADLFPLAGGRTARLNLNGEIRSATLQRQAPLPSAALSPGMAPLFLLVGVAVAASGGAAVYGWHRREAYRASVSREAESFLDLAGVRIQSGEFARALVWLERAREKAPKSARLAADHGFCLAKLGRIEEALQAWKEAHELARDGEHAYGAAGTLLDAGASFELVGEWLKRALEKTPGLVVQVEEEFAVVVDDPAWDEELRRAWERLGEGEPS